MKAFFGKQETRYIAPNIVADKLIELGFEILKVNKKTANGTDLQAIKNGVCFNFEIKQASKSTRSWRVGKTLSKTDDYIAIVFADKYVHFEPLSEHLNKCSKDGSRRITELAKLYV